MKKIIISGLATMVIGVAILIGCSKKSTDVQSAALTTSENTTSTTKNARLAAVDLSSETGGGGSNCNCRPPQDASCAADCWFGSCCVCYNPNTHEAICGCIGLFASCKTQKLKAARAEAKTEATTEATPNKHRVTIYHRRVKGLFALLKSKYKVDAGLFTAYNACKGKSARVNYTENFIADEASYELFIDKYKAFLDSLTEKQKEEFFAEIKKTIK
ncbi:MULTISPECIES: hypothetical protein [Niastella]|uniref:Lipoprotein n=1 Tax=Niastella soli TaxID=2821487 RepID=A0ABS3Z1I0_9BACT|nr:hypothetical protein [Niastella soli]MBO9204022.1 hypothetical protein [Niastella soli]